MDYLHSLFILLSVLLEQSLGVVVVCPDPWFQLQNGEWYLLSGNRATYSQVDTFCRGLHGYVVNISSQSDYRAIKQHLGDLGHGSVWVGGENRPEFWSSHWRSYYASGEPDFSGRCLYLSASRDFLWRDTDCATREKYAMCQMDPTRCSNNQGGEQGVSSSSNGDTDDACLTLTGQPCVFPFRYRGHFYTGCTAHSDMDTRPWCSTSTDNFGQHLPGSDSWGYCRQTQSCRVDNQ